MGTGRSTAIYEFVGGNGVLESGPAAGAVFGTVAELASRLGAVIFNPSRGAVVCGAEEHARLPSGMYDGAVVVDTTGEAVETALTGPRRSSHALRTRKIITLYGCSHTTS